MEHLNKTKISHPKLPTFLGIGVQRAATTWVHQCLSEHPDIYLPSIKEIHFFDENFDKGINWYQNFFKDITTETVAGEITPNYFNRGEAIPRIASILPDARLFIIFRNPVDRAYSAYRLFNEHYKNMTFKEACHNSDYLLKLSSYSKDLENVYSYFSHEKVKIFLFEDITEKPNKVIQELFGFLGVDDSFLPRSINTVYNAILYPKTQKIFEFFKIKWALEIFKSTNLGKYLKKHLIQRQNKNAGKKYPNNDNSQQGVSETEIYKNELKNYFKSDIIKLQNMIGRDLSEWM